jgi:hypothetical protein
MQTTTLGRSSGFAPYAIDPNPNIAGPSTAIPNKANPRNATDNTATSMHFRIATLLPFFNW